MTRRPGLRALVCLLLLAFPCACGDGPAAPSLPRLELVSVAGEGQYGTAGQRLQVPLQAGARRLDTGLPVEGVAVRWAVESGDASFATTPVGTTSALGLVSVTVQLGSAPGAVTIRATVVEQESATVTFRLFVAERPVLRSLSAPVLRGGDTLLVGGSGFSPTPSENVVLFSGIRGRVLAATPAQLAVEVPRCLPPRTVDVTAQLGALVSEPLALGVIDGGGAPTFAAGEPVDVADAAGSGCIRLPGGRRYLVVAQSVGTVGSARYDYTLRGLSTSGAPMPVERHGVPVGASAASPLQERFEAGLRDAEGRAVRARRALPHAAAPRAPGPERAVPTVGSRRAFRVLNTQGKLDEVQATVRLVGAQAVLYVDDAAPSGGYTADDLRAFSDTFDEFIHPTVTRAFGTPSDLDSNERVAILFTPAVNRLTPRRSDGFIGGFFYGLDLLDKEGSNRGEVFYALVPDSAGLFSDARPRDLARRVIPAILAHEFQHMVHFNERVLKRGAEGTEALWLSDGLAQMAEELVARALEEAGAAMEVEEYRSGNRTRARRYLADPPGVSLIVATGQGSLEERGAGWLYTLYLWDRWGKEDILARLTRSTLTGVANVAAATGVGWPALFADWAAALYADGLGGRYPFEYPTISLRDLLRAPSPYPLAPESLGSADFARDGSLWSSSAQHYLLVPPASGFVALRMGGAAGGNAAADAGLRLRVVPLH